MPDLGYNVLFSCVGEEVLLTLSVDKPSGRVERAAAAPLFGVCMRSCPSSRLACALSFRVCCISIGIVDLLYGRKIAPNP